MRVLKLAELLLTYYEFYVMYPNHNTTSSGFHIVTVLQATTMRGHACIMFHHDNIIQSCQSSGCLDLAANVIYFNATYFNTMSSWVKHTGTLQSQWTILRNVLCRNCELCISIPSSSGIAWASPGSKLELLEPSARVQTLPTLQVRGTRAVKVIWSTRSCWRVMELLWTGMDVLLLA